jgi:hypothetical protein
VVGESARRFDGVLGDVVSSIFGGWSMKSHDGQVFAVVGEVRDEQFWGISRVKKCHAAGTGRRLEVEGQRVICWT